MSNQPTPLTPATKLREQSIEDLARWYADAVAAGDTWNRDFVWTNAVLKYGVVAWLEARKAETERRASEAIHPETNTELIQTINDEIDSEATR